MESIKQFVSSIIESFLGPNKSYKSIIDGKEIHFTKCPVDLFQNINFKEPGIYLLEETLCAHHEQFNCSTLTLLTMWYLWFEEFKAAIEQGCEIADIIYYSQESLEHIISLLPNVTINLEEMLFLKKETAVNKHENIKNTKNSVALRKIALNASAKKTSILNTRPNSCMPVGIRYSSRHFSPSVCNEENFEPEIENETKTKFSEYNLSLESMKIVVHKLSHGDAELAKLICDVWVQQASNENIKFKVDGIITCPLMLPCSYSSVVEGLIIKSNFNSMLEGNFNYVANTKTLIIKASIVFEYTHLGFSPKVSVISKKKSDSLVSEKEKWVKKCSDKLSELQVNVLLVKGEVDSAISSVCSTNNILLLSEIPWKALKALCKATDTYPCTYLLDCDKKSITENIILKKWSLDHQICEKYCHISVTHKQNANLYTLVLCHPNPAILYSLEHQLWHLVYRLQHATEENKVLPGGGKTEEWCYLSLQKLVLGAENSNRVILALANGFQNFQKMLMDKTFTYDSEGLDDISSKVQAWKSALALAHIMLQCDSILINGHEDTKELNVNNFIGFL